MKKNLIECYHSHAFTHDYIFGVAVHGTVYMIKKSCNIADMEHYLTTQTASRGQGQTLKFVPTIAQKVELIANGEALPLCSVSYLENLVANSKYNRGQIFEKLVTEFYGQSWKADNVPFTQAGDIEIDGKPYQIKYQKASFLSEGQMLRLIANNNK